SGLKQGKRARRIVPHPALEENLSAESVLQAERIVAQVGPEVIMDLWEQNPDLDGVIAGRSLDVGLYAAIPLLHGFDKGLAMHFGKVMEVGPLAATPGSGNDGVSGLIREDNFDVSPTNPKRCGTPVSVIGLALYELSYPIRKANPDGFLDISQSVY